jgi:predicted nucleic acid-binding protein
VITAVDSSVLLDVITDDVRFGDSSSDALSRAVREGQLIVCECVLAEIRPAFASEGEFEEFLSDFEIDFLPSSRESAALAGSIYSGFLNRGGKKGRIVSDFLIGAHAKLHSDRLLARDRGFLRDYFKHLDVMDPHRPARPSSS